MRRMSHLRVIALGFFLIIALGTALLSLPWAAAGQRASFSTALFTAVSAACVTGLSVVETASFWSPLGQGVILLLIQVGGLGFMTLAVMGSLLLRRRVGLRNRELMLESVNLSGLGGAARLTRRILAVTLVCEGLGSAALAARFLPRFGPGRGLWMAVFHSVSAFCNAGFDLLGSSFAKYAGDGLVNAVLMALIIAGGLGFLVWDDLLSWGLRPRYWRTHTKVVLSVTAVLILGGAGALFWLEAGFTGAGKLLPTRLLEALFGSVTARTAGFYTVDTAALSPGGKLVTMVLMFIGGSPGSTAGGIKTTTALILLVHTWGTVRREQSIHLFGRRIDQETLSKASAVCATNLLLALGGALMLCGGSGLALTDALFECVSAISTVGMSTGVTAALSGPPLFAVAFLMYCGRVGSTSFALALLERRARPPVDYPVGKFIVG